jgi:hypothetical protein
MRSPARSLRYPCSRNADADGLAPSPRRLAPSKDSRRQDSRAARRVFLTVPSHRLDRVASAPADQSRGKVTDNRNRE